MRWLLGIVALAACTVGDGSGKARRWAPPEVLPEATPTGPSWLVRVTELRTTLARASIRLEMKVDKAVLESTSCAESKRRCVRCQLLAESDQLPGTALDEIVAAFQRYPTAFLETSKIEQVVLCRRLHNGTHAVSEPAGLADGRARLLFVNVNFLLEARMDFETSSLSQTVHHEVFHLVDRNEEIDDEWHGLNPAGFVYGTREDRHTRPEGFVDAYAATNTIEDRASVFEFLMSRPDELCALAKDDRIVAAKARLLLSRLAVLGDISFIQAPCKLD